MKRKALLTSEQYEALSEAEREDYVEYKSGAKELPGHWILDVEGFGDVRLENVGGLKRAYDSEKLARKTAEAALGPFKDLDADAARAALAKVSEMDNWSKDDQVKEQMDRFERQTTERFNKQQEDLSKKHKDEITKREERLAKLDKQLRKEMVESQLNAAIAAFEADPFTAGPVLRPRIQTQETESGELGIIVLDERGEVMLAPGNATANASISDLFASVRNDDRYARIFNSQKPGGSGATQSTTGRNGSGAGLRASDFQSQQAYEARVAQLRDAKQPLVFKQ